MTIYLTDDAFSIKAKCFKKKFTSILTLFFLLRIANKSHFYAPGFIENRNSLTLCLVGKGAKTSLVDKFCLAIGNFKFEFITVRLCYSLLAIHHNKLQNFLTLFISKTEIAFRFVS